jgi:hypothetical protein
MGGTIAITLREKDGTEYRMNRWTNTMPSFVEHTGFINGDKKHIEDFLSTWKKMKADSEAKSNKLIMTECYEPYDNICLHPNSYGLVVIDFVNNVILSMQSYTELGNILVTHSMLQNEHYYDEDYISVIKNFADAGTTKLKVSKTKELIEISSYEHLLRTLKKCDKFICNKLQLDMRPFSIEKFEETLEGSNLLRKRVLELGFKLSQKEIEMWDEWDREKEEEENYDDDEDEEEDEDDNVE